MSNNENLTYEEQLRLYDKQLETYKLEKEKIALELENNQIKKQLNAYDENNRIIEAMCENNALMKQNISITKNMFYVVIVAMICNMLLFTGYAIYSTDRMAMAFEDLNAKYIYESTSDNSINNNITGVETIDNSFNTSNLLKKQ